MKKLVLFICLLLFPVITNAKEFCTIESGNGNNIGDEIKCGTETFYVVSSNKEEISLLAKYNLLVGDKIDYFEVNNGIEYEMNDYNHPYLQNHNYYSQVAYEDCLNYAEEKGYKAYYVHPIMDDYETEKSTLLGCRVYEKIETEHIRQDKKAIGTKIVEGKSVLPIYGITYMHPHWGYEGYIEGKTNIIEYNMAGDIIYEDTLFNKYITGYKEELESQGIEIKDVSFFTLSKTLTLLETISGKEVINEMQLPTRYMDRYDPNSYIAKMDIKDYIGDKHKWISSTTYWLGSGFVGNPDYTTSMYNDYYISNEGLLCALGRGECSYLPYPIGNGVRPLVTIPKSSLKYNIYTKTNGKGTIEVVSSAYGEDKISFKITSEKGYVLSKLVITTDSGEKIEFSKGENITDSNGVISIDNNEFTMPYEHVTIEAQWKVENPETGNFMLYTLIVIIASTIIICSSKNKLSSMV